MNKLSFTIDNDLCICDWEKNIEEYTGKCGDEVLGKKYYDVFPRLCIEDKDTLSEAVNKKKSFLLENYNFNCLYCSVEADVRIKPLNGSNGNNKIQVSLNPASSCLFREGFIQSQGLADIGKIASSLAHGVRNPLNALKGAVVYLEEKYKDENTLTDFTKIMSEEIERLDNFISRFLSTSMSGFDTTDIDINSLIKKIEILVSLQAQANNIKTDFKYGTLPRIKINSYQIEQAILNVINNAIDAMSSDGDLKVRTYTRNISKKPHAIVSISDSGPGLPDCNAEYPSSDQSHTSGKGFGLIIVHEILRSCNGTMKIKSKKNVGTSVELYIPY
jgi:two-component system nitrogen regulation sensor histidine kinase GlnL